jgi:hypothetical protein
MSVQGAERNSLIQAIGHPEAKTGRRKSTPGKQKAPDFSEA